MVPAEKLLRFSGNENLIGRSSSFGIQVKGNAASLAAFAVAHVIVVPLHIFFREIIQGRILIHENQNVGVVFVTGLGNHILEFRLNGIL